MKLFAGFFKASTVLAVLFTTGINAQSASHNISAGSLQVVQNDMTNTTSSVTVTAPISFNGFSVREGSNRGDYFVQIGNSFSDDLTSGILMACISENGRDNNDTNSLGINYCTAAIDNSRPAPNTGGYYVSVSTSATGGEYNANAAAAFFPYTNWIGGLARNSGETNGGLNNLFTGSPWLTLGVHYVDNGGGTSTVNLASFGIDSRTSGVLLVNGGKNEDNYALSQVNTDGTWTVYCKDNGTDAGSSEPDPVAFVFIPKTNTTVVSGRFSGNGSLLLYSGATPQFTVTNTSIGTWRLTIPGHSPTTGVLILSAEGGSSQNQDNIVSYQADGDGWIIQSRDLPAGGLQTPNGTLEPVASFVFIPSPLAVNVVAPVDNAVNQVSNPALQLSVSNSSSGNINVKYYGRMAPLNPSEDFSMAVLPDTQFYADSAHGALPAMWYAQTEWIITNRVPQNIAYVAQLGDIVDHGDSNGGNPAAEWKVATNAMYRLENPTRTLLSYGIPYGAAVGNHDESPNGDATGTTIFYNQYFGTNHFAGKPYYAGHYGTNNDNFFDFFSAGGMDFIVLYFKYDNNADPNVLAWGNEVLRTNANRRAIIVTHNFGGSGLASGFSTQGAAIYKTVKTNANVFLMLAGHVTGEYARVDTFNGNTIHTYVQDFQGWTNGGNGFMRMFYFSPSNNQVAVQTFSPYTGEYETDANSEFFFSYNMQPSVGGTNAGPFTLIGSLTNVAPNSVASFTWSNRAVDTAYQWYAVVTDTSSNVVTTPQFRFYTAPNLPPVTSNQLVTVTADQPTLLTLPAYDVNGGPLTFFTNSFPTHGLNQNFNPSNGTMTYVPTRGYRGFDRFLFCASDGSATSSIVTFNLNILAPADTNSNGLPDTWETAFGITNPDADDDGDGQSNLNEYFANTNPTNAASVLRISQATRAANGHVTLIWPTVGGTRYRIQFSNGGTNGTFTGVFTDVVRPLDVEMSPVPYNTLSTQTFVDDFSLTGGATNGVRYYRLKTTQ